MLHIVVSQYINSKKLRQFFFEVQHLLYDQLLSLILQHVDMQDLNMLEDKWASMRSVKKPLLL